MYLALPLLSGESLGTGLGLTHTHPNWPKSTAMCNIQPQIVARVMTKFYRYIKTLMHGSCMNQK